MEEEKNNVLPEGEMAETVEEMVSILGAQTGVLSNALKLMDGKYGGAFYVRYICDTSRGCGWLQLLIQYPTGTVQTQLLCKNVCKVTSYEEDGLGEVESISYDRYQSGEKTVYKPHITDSMRSGLYDAMRVYERPNMPIPMKVLWKRIVENYAEIPTMELAVKSSLQDVYDALIEYGEKLASHDIRRMGNGYILLKKDEVEQVVSEFGYALQEIRTEFAVRGLWVTDNNSGSYQKTKKIDKVNCRFYALKVRLQNDKATECKVVDDVSYEETVPPTKEAAELQQLQSAYADMKKQRDDMVQLVCERVPDLSQQEIMEKLL